MAAALTWAVAQDRLKYQLGERTAACGPQRLSIPGYDHWPGPLRKYPPMDITFESKIASRRPLRRVSPHLAIWFDV
jgi:hypothetical protein